MRKNIRHLKVYCSTIDTKPSITNTIPSSIRHRKGKYRNFAEFFTNLIGDGEKFPSCFILNTRVKNPGSMYITKLPEVVPTASNT